MTLPNPGLEIDLVLKNGPENQIMQKYNALIHKKMYIIVKMILVTKVTVLVG